MIIYTGWYGFQNVGDDSFVYITDWQLKNKYPQAEVLCLSPQQYGKGVKSLFLASKMSYRAYLLSLIWYIPKSDALVFSGGTMFKKRYSVFSAEHLIKILCTLFRVRLGTIGVSVGPFPKYANEKGWISFFKEMKFISLRDRRSYEWLNKRGIDNITLGFDMATLLPEYCRDNGITFPQQDDNTIGISLCSFATKDFQDNVFNSLKEFFSVEKRCEKILLFVFKAGDMGDKPISEKMACFLRDIGYMAEIIDYCSPFEIIANMKRCKLMICTRLHAGIFSYAFKIPFVMFEYEQKCSDFLDEIHYPKDLRLNDHQNIEVVSSKLNSEGDKIFNYIDNKIKEAETVVEPLSLLSIKTI